VSADAERLDGALRALVDPKRRTILGIVHGRALPVGEIAARLDMSQQVASHHLAVLREAGLVTEQRDGTRHLYMVRTDGFRIMQDYLADFWPARLTALKQASERTARKRARG
jgi:DNA-binding transcriptional ArsR family regulator